MTPSIIPARAYSPRGYTAFWFPAVLLAVVMCVAPALFAACARRNTAGLLRKRGDWPGRKAGASL